MLKLVAGEGVTLCVATRAFSLSKVIYFLGSGILPPEDLSSDHLLNASNHTTNRSSDQLVTSTKHDFLKDIRINKDVSVSVRTSVSTSGNLYALKGTRIS